MRPDPRPPTASLVAAGLCTGFVAAFFGIGGGVILVPVLTGLFGLDQRKAAGTSLGVVVFVAGAAALGDLVDPAAGHRPALVAALLVLAASIPAARFWGRRAHRLPVRPLRRIFGAVLLFGAANLAGLLPLSAGRGPFVYGDGVGLDLIALPLLGAVVGTLSALLGIGGGVVLVPALAFLYQDLPLTRCRATSLLVVAPSALSGFLAHRSQGTAAIGLSFRLVPACLIGTAAGVAMVHRAAPETFRIAFALLLGSLGAKLLVVPGARACPD